MIKIQLSKYEVEVKEALTWWDSQELLAIQISSAKMNNTLLNGVDGEAMIKANLKLIEKMVTSVKEGEKEIGFSESWIKSLSMADGSKLLADIEAITNKDSKKN
jgi:hypothetical protein